MAKIIKKIVRVLLIITGVLIMVSLTLFLLLQTPRIQTFTVGKITKVIADKTGSLIAASRWYVCVNYTVLASNRDP